MRRLDPDRIVKAVAATGSIRKAAMDLGVPRSTLQDHIQALGLEEAIVAARQATRRTSPGSTTRAAKAAADELDPTDPLRLENTRQAAEVRQLRADLRKAMEVLSDREEFVERMMEAAKIPVEVPRYDVAPQDGTLPERSIVLPIFDLQYGQFVRPTDVPFGQGGFSPEVFDTRLKAYVEKVCRFLRDRAATTRFSELHLVLGGDLVEGAEIFAGQAWQLAMDPAMQVWTLAEKLVSALREIIRFAKEVLGIPVIALYSVPGNHGKLGGKRAGAMPTTASWDWLTSQIIIERLGNEPLDLAVNESAGALMFETLGQSFLVIHGDEVKGHSGIPFYGFTKLDGKMIRLAETVYDYCLSGHIHQPATIPNGSGGEFIISGDWVGGNNLSKYIVAASRPQQRALLIGRKYGVATDERIYLDGDRSKRRKPLVHNAAKARR